MKVVRRGCYLADAMFTPTLNGAVHFHGWVDQKHLVSKGFSFFYVFVVS